MSLKNFLITFSPLFILGWMLLFLFGMISFRLFFLPLLLLYPVLIVDDWQSWCSKHQKTVLLSLVLNTLTLASGLVLFFSSDVYTSPFYKPWQFLIYLHLALNEVQELLTQPMSKKQRIGKIVYLVALSVILLNLIWLYTLLRRKISSDTVESFLSERIPFPSRRGDFYFSCHRGFTLCTPTSFL